MFKKQLFIIFFGFIFFTTNITAQEILDGIAAIVGENIITKSELDQTAQSLAYQSGIIPSDQPEKYNKLKKQVLDDLINEKILLAKAKEDTIEASDQNVENELNRRIEQLIQQFGSKEEVEKRFGKSISETKEFYRTDIKNGLTIQMLQQQQFKDISVTRNEVVDFYNTIKDSLPAIQESIKLRHILMKVKASEEQRKKAMDKFLSFKKQLKAGRSFEELAKRYSEDPSTAPLGGDLGFIERGSLYPSFEEAAFGLKVGEISNVVETPIGLHVIKAVEKDENKMRVRHILFSMTTTKEDEKRVIKTLQELRQRAQEGEDFTQLAREYSEDESTKEEGGDLGWVQPQLLQIPEFKSAVEGLKEGDISRPFKTDYGYHIIQVVEREEGRQLSLEHDYERLKAQALQNKQQQMLLDWIDELKEDIYIQIKEDMIE
ncbi:MAG: peptidylprolyl isomerase [bacterium]